MCLLLKRSSHEKKQVLAMVNAFPYCGFSTRITGNICYYYKSFVGRDFKSWMQMSLFIAPLITSHPTNLLDPSPQKDRGILTMESVLVSPLMIFYRSRPPIMMGGSWEVWGAREACDCISERLKSGVPAIYG